MQEKQARYVLSQFMKRFSVGDSPLTEEDWIDSHIQNIYDKGDGSWVQWIAFRYLDELRDELEKKYL